MQLHSLYSGVPFIEIGGHINDFGGFQRTLAPKSPGCTYQSAHLTLTSPGKKDRGGICASLRGIHVWNRKFCTGTWILTPLGVQRCCCAGALCSKVLIWRWVALGCISMQTYLKPGRERENTRHTMLDFTWRKYISAAKLHTKTGLFQVD